MAENLLPIRPSRMAAAPIHPGMVADHIRPAMAVARVPLAMAARIPLAMATNHRAPISRTTTHRCRTTGPTRTFPDTRTRQTCRPGGKRN